MLSQELRSDTNFVVLASTKTYALPSYKPNKGDLCFSSTEKYLKVWNDTFLKAGTQGYKEEKHFFSRKPRWGMHGFQHYEQIKMCVITTILLCLSQGFLSFVHKLNGPDRIPQYVNACKLSCWSITRWSKGTRLDVDPAALHCDEALSKLNSDLSPVCCGARGIRTIRTLCVALWNHMAQHSPHPSSLHFRRCAGAYV